MYAEYHLIKLNAYIGRYIKQSFSKSIEYEQGNKMLEYACILKRRLRKPMKQIRVSRLNRSPKIANNW